MNKRIARKIIKRQNEALTEGGKAPPKRLLLRASKKLRVEAVPPQQIS